MYCVVSSSMMDAEPELDGDAFEALEPCPDPHALFVLCVALLIYEYNFMCVNVCDLFSAHTTSALLLACGECGMMPFGA